MHTPPTHAPADWQLVKQLYDQACGLAAQDRATFVAHAAAPDAVRAEVLSLLAHEPDQTGPGSSFLSQPAAMDLLAVVDRTGMHLGAWRVVRTLGVGGMGDVFEAHRADGSFEGRAAIKLLKRGMDSAAVLQRFAQERQALARLNHPHIATLLDAGLSSDGVPFFVMELVDGKPIDEAVTGLSVEQRLELFLQLADAVAYAHRNLLVHRDLKPGNVLVTPQGDVKLLDFGIAKALDPMEDGLAYGNTTVGAVRVFTTNYASPEQIRGEPVTTATDIYSLGVLLYELLTGLRPTGRNATTPAEAARSVLEEAPSRPSSPSAAQVVDPLWMETRRRLQGDLDNIMLKALEKPAERRYASVEALAQDVRNVLTGHPVSARAPTLLYVAGKFLKRHRWSAGLSALGVASLCALTGVALWQANVAERERQAAQHHLDDVRALARTMIVDVNDAISSGITPGRAALVKAASEYLTRRMNATDLNLADTLDMVDALRRMADIEGNTGTDNLGQQDSALRRYAQALALLDRVPEVQRTDPQWWFKAAGVHRSQSMVLHSHGDVAKGLEGARLGAAQVQKAIAMGYTEPKVRRLACLLLFEVVDALYDAGGAPHLGRLDDALASAREGVQCAEKLPTTPQEADTNTLVLSSAMHRLARLAMIAGQLEEGIAVAQQNFDVMSALFAREPKNQEVSRFTSIARSLLGYNLIHAGQPEAGIKALTQGVGAARQQVRSDPQDDRARRDFVTLEWTLGEALIVLGDGKLALQLCNEADAAYRVFTTSDGEDPELARYKDGVERCLAGSLLLLHKPQDALRVINTSLEQIHTRMVKAKNSDRHNDLQGLGLGQLLRARALQQMGSYEEALTQARHAVLRMDELLSVDKTNTETQGDNAYVRSQASVLGAPNSLRKDAVQCQWAQEADRKFKSLAAHSHLNLEFKDDARHAATQAQRCAALPA